MSQLTKFQADPREGHLKAACGTWECLETYPRFGVLEDPSSPALSSTATAVDKELFKNVPHFATGYETSGLSLENSVSSLQDWSCVDSALYSDNQNGRDSVGCMVMVGSTTVVSNVTL